MSNRTIRWIVFVLLFLAELLFGFYVSLELGFVSKDALSRTANAFYVLYSRDPHLAAIGFVWNPLPGLLSLPLLLLNPIFPTLSSVGLAGTLLSALFAGLALFALLHAFDANREEDAPESNIPFFLCVALFALHPFVFWYGANGMSEAMFAFFLLFAVIQWTGWLNTRSQKSFILASIGLGFAFLCRYESLPFTAAMFVATLIVLYRRRSPASKGESSAIVLLLPTLCAVGVWVWMNYSIMGDALYFLRSEYSNYGQSESLSDVNAVASLAGNAAASLAYVLERTWLFLLPYAMIALYRTLTGKLFRADFICLTMLIAAIPALHWYMIVQGLSFGWLRFFYYPFVIAMAWLPYEFAKSRMDTLRRLLHWGSVASLALSFFVILPAVSNPRLAPEEFAALNFGQSQSRQQSLEARQIAGMLDERIFAKNPETLILADSFNSFEIIVNSRYPDRFISTTDRDYWSSLRNPSAFRSLYFLVPRPVGLGGLNSISEEYPDIYNEAYGWAQLEWEASDWRLLRILREP